ncbi:hypothetical protein B0T22DRAFT_532340 [Podospora appendiculata]|uniref:LysM domain-containing protein n=1 Tax=Podospora appendiculata TaxID=314037 RepID=A0AAE0XGE6_9PEZI|nr:hypothetical protein B0T22DRAFT_532340 [Podospora appendiculata]
MATERPLMFTAVAASLFLGSGLWGWTAQAEFHLYPNGIIPDKLATALGVSLSCIQGLNTTLPGCDQDLFTMAVEYDKYWWEMDNITDLCGSTCQQEAGIWYSDVMSYCSGDWLKAAGSWIPADSVAGRYADGVNTLCLWSYKKDDYCYPQSQQWVGSDFYQVDCDVSPSDPSCANNGTGIDAASQRMANLYNDTLLLVTVLEDPAWHQDSVADAVLHPTRQLCDDCFIKVLYNRVSSPFLADSDNVEYLVNQLQDIADVCSTSLPPITTRAVIKWEGLPTTVVKTTATATGSGSASASATPTTCAGQVISTNAGLGCDALSTKYGLATGNLKVISGSDTCVISSAKCFPSKCNLAVVPAGATCETMAKSLNGTVIQFQQWNPNLKGLCDALLKGQYICTAAPGVNGTYVLAAPPLAAAGNDGNQQRGGPGGVVTPTTTIALGPSTPVAAPGPTQSNVSPLCNAWQTPGQGLGCIDFATFNGITSAQLYAWNPVLGATGENCLTSFWFAEYYCVGVVRGSGGVAVSSGTITSSTRSASASASASSTVITPPGPTQAGIISTCNKYALASGGLGCYDFAVANGITPAQLYLWNTVLGTNGANCGTAFWNAEAYCVGVATAAASSSTSKPASSSTKTSTTSASGPGPTQTGIISTCNKYAVASGGLGCYDFAVANGITPALLYQWNTVLGTNGANCGTLFWANEAYCVGVGAAGPTQAGIISTCYKYAVASGGLGCYDFAVANGITPAQLYTWNTVLGTNGANCGTLFWANEYYCVGAF